MTRITPYHSGEGFSTRAVHAGQVPDPLTGAVMTPIYQTSTYVQEGLGKHKGYEYARTQNPTREALERNIANLEGGEFGFAFSSGLASIDAVLKLLSAGDHVICGENVYGGTHRMMERIYGRMGMTFSFVDMQDSENVARAITPSTRLVFCETPTNPMMVLADLGAIGDICQARGLLLVVDNATYHTSKTVVAWLKAHPRVLLLYLPARRPDLRVTRSAGRSRLLPMPTSCWDG